MTWVARLGLFEKKRLNTREFELVYPGCELREDLKSQSLGEKSQTLRYVGHVDADGECSGHAVVVCGGSTGVYIGSITSDLQNVPSPSRVTSAGTRAAAQC